MAGKSLTATLFDGLEVTSRKDGSVHTIRNAEKRIVAELCVGIRRSRLNFRDKPKSLPKGLALDGKSKAWAGGGIVVDESNVAEVRALLVSVAAPVALTSALKPGKSGVAKRRPRSSGRVAA